MVKRVFPGILLLLLAVISLCAAACKKVGEEDLPLPVISSSSAPTEVESETPTASKSAEPVYISLTTGQEIAEPTYHPIMVMIENSSYARPQTNLMQADVIYEAPVEATITRFICLFNDTLPTVVGPVRSARIYFLNIQKEWDAVMVHFGGASTPGVESYIYGSNTNYIKVRVDGIKGKYDDYFWRSSDHSAPHNVFSDLTFIKEKLYNYTPNTRKGWQFEKDTDYADAKTVDRIGIPFVTDDTSKVEFVYNAEEDCFYRYEDGDPFMTVTVTEDNSGVKTQVTEQLHVQNLIILYAKVYLIPNDGGRRMAVLTGTGKCDYFIGGQHVTGYWVRDSLDDTTVYYTDDGAEVTFRPGNTWVAIQPNSGKIAIDYVS